MEKMRPIMIAGTGSDVGKSMIVAALCRLLREDGFRPAPFKAQNMAPYYYTAPNGDRISVAQALQAVAAGVEPEALLNPVLMMPSSVTSAHIYCLGKEVGEQHARDYFRQSEGRKELQSHAWEAFDQLKTRYNPIVLEGAGSVSELNLLDTDFVNMPMAEHADAAVILVADIERGGVFASVYGSVMLQRPEHRKLIKGVLINKFRGDLSIFAPATKMIEELCGVPVLGVVPYMEGVELPSEDTLSDKSAHKSDYTDKDIEKLEDTFDQLASHLRSHIDVELLYKILRYEA
ncbi:cobyric acid synthase [Porphyromonas somerae]|uniref:cobyric acid synthase n=1 Tax=Porphyromonas somerae TaxID=322095 RepID=UPI002A749836|nr:cobyric acid synthase [Porphyromonas somerae]MDY3120151.1 cobyric acid synthase [Porphyromonas somerae]